MQRNNMLESEVGTHKELLHVRKKSHAFSFSISKMKGKGKVASPEAVLRKLSRELLSF